VLNKGFGLRGFASVICKLRKRVGFTLDHNSLLKVGTILSRSQPLINTERATTNNKTNIMEELNIQSLIANAVAQAMQAQVQAPAPAPARDYFAEAEALRKQAQELNKVAINGLAVTSDDAYAEIRQSRVSGIATEATKTINKVGGTRYSDDQKADLKVAREEHKEKINDSEFKSQLSAIIGSDDTELDSYKQGLPNKEGNIKRTLSWY